jgi:hypothetical protein
LANDAGSDDKHLDTLDFVMNSLQEHEKAIDELIDALKTYTQSIPSIIKLKERIDSVNQSVDALQKQIADLGSYLKTTSNKTAPSSSSQTPKENTTPTPFSSEIPIIIRCQQWNEFVMFAKQAQMVSVNYQEDKKLLEVTALRGKQLIIYSGDYSISAPAIRTFLSSTFRIGEQAIFEGSLNPK